MHRQSELWEALIRYVHDTTQAARFHEYHAHEVQILPVLLVLCLLLHLYCHLPNALPPETSARSAVSHRYATAKADRHNIHDTRQQVIFWTAGLARVCLARQ